MDGLLVLLAIAFAGLVLLGVPVALVRQGSLQRQIRDLQKDLGMLAQELRDLKREGLRPAKTPATELVSEPEAPQTTTSEPMTASATPARVQPAAAASVQDKAARSSVPPVARRPVSAAPTEPKAFVFTEGKMEALTDWLKVNWVLAIAAASLGFAGIFMVQYGIEHGVLSPFWRVMAAFGFGGALVAAGEYVRRRYGDEGEEAMRHVPSVLSGAGVLRFLRGCSRRG